MEALQTKLANLEKERHQHNESALKDKQIQNELLEQIQRQLSKISHLEEVEAKSADLHIRLEDQTRQLELAKNELDNAKVEMNNAIRARDSVTKNIQDSLDEKVKEVTRLEARISDLECERSDLQERIESLEMELANRDEQLIHVSAESQRTQKRLQDSIASLQEEKLLIEGQASQLEKRSQDQLAALTQLELQHAKDVNAIKELRMSLSAAVEAAASTAASLSQQSVETTRPFTESEHSLMDQSQRTSSNTSGAYKHRRRSSSENAGDSSQSTQAPGDQHHASSEENVPTAKQNIGKSSPAGAKQTEALSPTPTSAQWPKREHVRVIFTGFADKPHQPDWKYTTAMKQKLKAYVRALGGSAPDDQKIIVSVTHIVVPNEARSAKSLAGALLGKCVIPPEWVMDSHRAGSFLPESRYVAAPKDHMPFKGRIFYLSDSFRARWGKSADKMCHVTLKLAITCGNGIDWSVKKDPAIPCDYTLVGDGEREYRPAAEDKVYPNRPGMLLTWNEFLDLIPGVKGTARIDFHSPTKMKTPERVKRRPQSANKPTSRSKEGSVSRSGAHDVSHKAESDPGSIKDTTLCIAASPSVSQNNDNQEARSAFPSRRRRRRGSVKSPNGGPKLRISAGLRLSQTSQQSATTSDAENVEPGETD